MTGELVSTSGFTPGGVAHDDASPGAIHGWETHYKSVLSCHSPHLSVLLHIPLITNYKL